MDTPEHLQLFNHLYPVPKPGALNKLTPFTALHEDNLHLVDGEEHYAIPLPAAAAWLVANKDDPAAFEAVSCLLVKRRIFLNTLALCGEPLDKFKQRVLGHVPDTTSKRTLQQTLPRSARPAATDEAGWEALGKKYGLNWHKSTTDVDAILQVDTEYGDGRLKSDGPPSETIVPVDLSWAGKLFGYHQHHAGRPRSLKDEYVGGLHSVTAHAKLDEFLQQVVGLKPNHDYIQKHPAFCYGCNQTGQPQTLTLPEVAPAQATA
jgi:hypothetical protein